MEDYINKIERNIFKNISKIEKPMILELGVQNGISTKKFINLCKENNGHLYSVDINDCSNVSSDNSWTFIKSRDDNFDYIKSIIPKKIDVLYIDTLHEADHVSKIIYGYYDMIKIGGLIFIDDISHLPYLKGHNKNNFYCEINNKETFSKILEIYFHNYENFFLDFSFQSSGLAIIIKKNDNLLNKSKKLISKEFSIKNILRKIWIKVKKN